MDGPDRFTDIELAYLCRFYLAHRNDPEVEIREEWILAITLRLFEILSAKAPRGRPKTRLAEAVTYAELFMKQWKMPQAEAIRLAARWEVLEVAAVRRAFLKARQKRDK